MERDDIAAAQSVIETGFQPTLSVWRETDRLVGACHADCISTHSLRVERDSHVQRVQHIFQQFQPTLSVWRETKTK